MLYFVFWYLLLVIFAYWCQFVFELCIFDIPLVSSTFPLLLLLFFTNSLRFLIHLNYKPTLFLGHTWLLKLVCLFTNMFQRKICVLLHIDTIWEQTVIIYKILMKKNRLLWGKKRRKFWEPYERWKIKHIFFFYLSRNVYLNFFSLNFLHFNCNRLCQQFWNTDCLFFVLN